MCKIRRILFFIAMVIISLTGETHAFQRMGVIAGANITIPGLGSGELPAFCMDVDESAPTVTNSLDQVLNGNPDAIVVKTENESLSLREAIEKKIISISGVSENERIRFNAVRVNNLTDKPIHMHVLDAVVLGSSLGSATNQTPFDIDVSRLMMEVEDQGSLWEAIRKAEERRE